MYDAMVLPDMPVSQCSQKHSMMYFPVNQHTLLFKVTLWPHDLVRLN